jgi:NADPH-dependent curcumin reductase CurA
MGKWWIFLIRDKRNTRAPAVPMSVIPKVAKINRRIVLASRPIGVPEPQHFTRDDQVLEPLSDGQFRVRNLYLSVDPAQRGWVNASSNYSEPVPIGGVMRALAVGMVEASYNPNILVGERLYGWFGWQDYCAATESAVIAKVNPNHGPDSAALGVLGINGVTAYLALLEIGLPQPGETVLVSTAAGSVGSIVGQIARHLGCYVVGLTGSSDKASQCVAEFGYHAALNYRTAMGKADIAALCPRGIDVYFDNTSGGISDALWPFMNLRGRIIQCGTAAVATWDPPPTAPRREREVLTKRLRHEGFVVFDHVKRFPAVIEQLATWLKAGTLVYREDIEDGLERAPHALAAIYRGENRGKKIIRMEGVLHSPLARKA